MLERLLQLVVLSPYFYFFHWIEKADKDSKYFAFFYYFYWIYLPLWALFSIAFTIFSFLIFNFQFCLEKSYVSNKVGNLDFFGFFISSE